MNVSEILITVGLTVLAAAVIAYTTFRLQARHRERVLFRAFQSEIELNKIKLKNSIMEWRMYNSGRRRYCPDAPILFTESYEALRLSGELLKLPGTVRNRLNNTLSLIAIHNLRMSEAGLDYLQVKGGLEQTEYRMDIILKNLKVLEDELAKKVQKPTKRSDYTQQDWKRRYIVSQVPTFFFFGSLSILAHHLIVQRATMIMSAGEKVQYAIGWLSLPLGIIAILWAIALLTVGLNLKILSKAKKVGAAITKLIEGNNELFYYIATVTVFGISFASVLVHMKQVGMNDIYIYILFGVACLLLFSFAYNIYLSARQRKRLKNSTTQNIESHNHDA